MLLTEGVVSPPIYRRWAAIALVAGALERRVWVKTERRITFPNLYTLLVGSPAVGKYIIEDVRDLWTNAKSPGTKTAVFKVAPDSVTRASLVDTLAKAKNVILPPVGSPITTHPLLVTSEEVSLLLPAYDLDFIGVLNSIYNNKPLHEESRRTGSVKELLIERPQLNILAGAQPGWLASVFPETAWSTGLTSRMLMIYASEPPLRPLFEEEVEPTEVRAKLLESLTSLAGLYGQAKWTPDAAERLNEWHMAGGPPIPTHSRLVHYNRRRTKMHVPKLTLISAVARTGGLVIELVDVERAIAWLLEAESLMPDIFRAMIGKSDAQVIEELHYFMSAMYNKDKERKPIHDSLLAEFLHQRVPSDKVNMILAIAQRVGVIARSENASDFYIPRPTMGRKVE